MRHEMIWRFFEIRFFFYLHQVEFIDVPRLKNNLYGDLKDLLFLFSLLDFILFFFYIMIIIFYVDVNLCWFKVGTFVILVEVVKRMFFFFGFGVKLI